MQPDSYRESVSGSAGKVADRDPAHDPAYVPIQGTCRVLAEPALHCFFHDFPGGLIDACIQLIRGKRMRHDADNILHIFSIDKRLPAELSEDGIRCGNSRSRHRRRPGPHDRRLAAAEEILPLRPCVQPFEHVLSEHLLGPGDRSAVLECVTLNCPRGGHFGKAHSLRKARKALFENADQTYLFRLFLALIG